MHTDRTAIRVCTVVLAASLLATVCLQPARAADEPMKVSVRGIRVIGPAYGDEQNELTAFNWQTGTAVALLVERPGAGLISFDDDASKLESFTDDQGDTLIKDEGFNRGGFSPFANFSKDGKAAMIEVSGGGVPGEKARGVQLKGKLVFKVGSTKKTDAQKGVKLEKGSKITAGPVPFTIESAGKPDFGDAELQITLKTDKDTDTIAGIRFLAADGGEIESSEAGGSRMGFGGKVEIEKNYTLAKKVDAVTVEITHWTDMKTLEVPIDVKTGVGMAK